MRYTHVRFRPISPFIISSIFVLVLLYKFFSNLQSSNSALRHACLAHDGTSKTVIVTAANSQYFDGLTNLIGSISFWEPGRSIAVYNLGLSGKQLIQLSQMCQVNIHWKNGMPPDLPKHLKEPYVYAWKPFVVKDAVDEYQNVFWMDGGSDLRGHFDLIEKDLESDGFFFVGSNYYFSGMDELLHPGMYEYLNLSRSDFKDKEVYWATYQGYVKNSWAYDHILKPLVRCAGEKDCIAPKGSNLSNHRYDQSALALMIHWSGINMTSRKHYVIEMYLREHFDSDPTKENGLLLFTARKTSQDYVKYIRIR